MSFIHASREGKPKIPPPKCSNKIFYTKRMEDPELEKLLEFGICYALGIRKFEVEIEHPDTALERAIAKMREMNYCQGKIDYIIRRKMNKVKMGGEVGRIVRKIKTINKRVFFPDRIKLAQCGDCGEKNHLQVGKNMI